MLRTAKIVLILFVLSALPALAQQKTKRLILKSGDYQTVTEYQVIGERVHYYSAERHVWEDVPKSMIDWDATKKFEQAAASGTADPEAAQAAADFEKENKLRDQRRPEVFPGLRLPEDGGVFLLDEFQRQPALVELVQNGAEINKHTGGNILRAMVNPLSVARQTVELQGEHARVQSHLAAPAIYVDITIDDTSGKSNDEDDDADKKASTVTVQQLHRFRIIKAEQKGGNRIVGNLKIAMTGRVKQEQEWVETVSTPVAGDWVKVTPAKPLGPGEYALVEMLGEKQMNIYVWDFGINPGAPPNPSAWKPLQPAQSKTGTNESPVLSPRKK